MATNTLPNECISLIECYYSPRLVCVRVAKDGQSTLVARIREYNPATKDFDLFETGLLPGNYWVCTVKLTSDAFLIITREELLYPEHKSSKPLCTIYCPNMTPHFFDTESEQGKAFFASERKLLYPPIVSQSEDYKAKMWAERMVEVINITPECQVIRGNFQGYIDYSDTHIVLVATHSPVRAVWTVHKTIPEMDLLDRGSWENKIDTKAPPPTYWTNVDMFYIQFGDYVYHVSDRGVVMGISNPVDQSIVFTRRLNFDIITRGGQNVSGCLDYM